MLFFQEDEIYSRVYGLKVDQSAEEAIEQIKQKAYYQIYNDRKIPIYLIGINFNSQHRAIDDWRVELYTLPVSDHLIP